MQYNYLNFQSTKKDQGEHFHIPLSGNSVMYQSTTLWRMLSWSSKKLVCYYFTVILIWFSPLTFWMSQKPIVWIYSDPHQMVGRVRRSNISTTKTWFLTYLSVPRMWQNLLFYLFIFYKSEVIIHSYHTLLYFNFFIYCPLWRRGHILSSALLCQVFFVFLVPFTIQEYSVVVFMRWYLVVCTWIAVP